MEKDGGILYIGVNDDGYVVGVDDSRKLLESLPSKINDKLGIVTSITIYHVEKRGTNIKYGVDVPSDIEKRLVNKYIKGEIDSKKIRMERWIILV